MVAEGHKEFKCVTCNASFGRREHLQRHTKLHTGAKPYRCPCGKFFSRSDVLAQHISHCPKASKPTMLSNEKRRQMKFACDQCARAKSRCDSQEIPCARCRHKLLVCSYTRGDYGDKYRDFLVREETPNTSSTPETSCSISEGQGDALSFSTPGISEASASLTHLQQTQDILTPQQQAVSGPDSSMLSVEELFFNNPYFDPGQSIWNLCRQSNHCAPTLLPSQNILHRFSLRQLDPVEAACRDIRGLLQGSALIVSDAIIAGFVTRDNLLHFCELFGDYVMDHFPILHGPSFQLGHASSTLLAAMMIVGSCFAGEQIRAATITQLAMALLKAIENSDHEIHMEAPPLETIQASTIACAALFCSRDEKACKFVTAYFPRNFSMAKRAGLFRTSASTEVDYDTMDDADFDWSQWIEQETGRRLCCEILCQDIAASMFLGTQPVTSVLDKNIVLPCYESCWEAGGPSQCLQELRRWPRSIDMVTALQLFRHPPADLLSSLEMSGYGMFVLIKVLHSRLLQVIKNDNEFFPPEKNGHTIHPTDLPSARMGNLLDIEKILEQDLSGPAVAALADEAVAVSSNASMRVVNDALNAWHGVWQTRVYRELQHEEHTFFNNPLPFWWLAKLYVVLHEYRAVIRSGSEFATPRPQELDGMSPLPTQSKILSWLTRFRARACGSEPFGVHILSKLGGAKVVS